MRHFLIILLVLCTFCRIYGVLKARFFSGTLKVTFFDVGQGDSALLQFPKGSTLLIDAGRGFRDWDLGKAVLVRELGLRSILSLDRLVMTHPDQDHAFGFRGILSELRVKEFWMNADFLKNPNRFLVERLDLAKKQGSQLKALSEVETHEIDGVRSVFFPLHIDSKKNNNSLVTFFELGACQVLLTGDIEKKAEEVLATNVETAEILKIAHHGSRTSSTEHFLRKVKPRVGLLSVGFKNQYGHPNKSVTDRLADLGIEVFRTDFHGMTVFETDGKRWNCSTTKGTCGSFECSR